VGAASGLLRGRARGCAGNQVAEGGADCCLSGDFVSFRLGGVGDGFEGEFCEFDDPGDGLESVEGRFELGVDSLARIAHGAFCVLGRGYVLAWWRGVWGSWFSCRAMSAREVRAARAAGGVTVVAAE